MIAPCRKSQAGLFHAKASFARIGSPVLTFVASKRWTSSAHTGAGVCAKRRCGGDQSRAKQEKTRKRLHHDIGALLLNYCRNATACRKRSKPGWRFSTSNPQVGPKKNTPQW